MHRVVLSLSSAQEAVLVHLRAHHPKAYLREQAAPCSRWPRAPRCRRWPGSPIRLIVESLMGPVRYEGMSRSMGKMGVVMAKPAGRRSNVTLMVCVAALIALPGAVAESGVLAAPAGPGMLPALDHFLGSVRAATPPTARLLVAGNPPAFVFYRATYLLYPRRVYNTTSTDYAQAFTAPTLTWRDLEHHARHDGARAVLLWSLPVTTRARVLVRVGAGRLVEVTP